MKNKTDPKRICTKVAVPPTEPKAANATALVRAIVSEASWIDPRSYPKEFLGQLGKDTPLERACEVVATAILEKPWVSFGSESKGTYLKLPGAKLHRQFRRRKNIAYWAPLDWPAMQLTNHQQAVFKIMKTLDAPTARADESDQTLDWIPADDYSGLWYPRWRMWFGKEYIEFFGREKLLSAPARSVDDLGGIVFVELFEDATRWQEAPERAAAERFMDHLGRDCFFDPEQPERKLRHPDFGELE